MEKKQKRNVGYVRVSSTDQNSARQLDGVELDIIFEDKCSGATLNRPKLKECLNYLHKGDTLHVHEISRLSRNLIDLKKTVERLVKKGISIYFHKEGMKFDPEKKISPITKMIFYIMGVFAEFERDMIRERQAEGIAKAKANGKRLGRKPKLSDEDLELMKDLKDDEYCVDDIGKLFRITRQGVYKALKRYRERIEKQIKG